VELADEQGISLPHQDPGILAGWFQGTVAEPIVTHWDEKFGITTRVMQDADAIARVAREYVLELAADGVVYGETRWAPEKHIDGGLTLDEAVEAVAAGLGEGERIAAAAGRPIRVRQLLCGMRTSSRSAQIAELAIRHHDVGAGVVGFDIAGEERGHPAADHAAACARLHAAGVPFTFHSGEGDGVLSLQQTVHECHAQRIGHGVRVVEDMRLDGRPLDIRTA